MASNELAALRAELTAVRDAAAAREAQLLDQLSQLRRSGGTAATAPGASTRLLSRAPTLPLRKLASPSESKGVRIIDGTLCVLVERPVAAAMLSITLPAPSVADAFGALLDACRDPRVMSAESSFYALASLHLPVGAKRVGDEPRE